VLYGTRDPSLDGRTLRMTDGLCHWCQAPKKAKLTWHDGIARVPGTEATV